MSREEIVSDDRLLAFADRLRHGENEEEQDVERPEIWVSFIVGQGRFALPVGQVREVAAFPTLTRVPGAPPAVRGVASLRGHSIPVIDLERLLGLAGQTGTCDHLLVVQHEGRNLGLAVDRVEHVLKLLPSGIVAADPQAGTDHRTRIRGSYRDDDSELTLLASDFLTATDETD